jgi:hypothetical protein
MNVSPPTYHVLLIGIDRYPLGYRSLRGCVNDIDAIENLLYTLADVGSIPSQLHITRLAAPQPGRSSTSRLQVETLPPTRANLVQALDALASPEIRPEDRVLIYYSGHGDEKLWTGSSVWHEALVPHNNQVIEYLFDVEINQLIGSIAARTSDLTIILDCCHSAGATRGIEGDVRALTSDSAPISPPDLAALGIDGDAAADRGLSTRTLQNANPSYLVVVACQAYEKASEGAGTADQAAHGVFTHSLLSVLNARDVMRWPELRWADIWPDLLAKAEARNSELRQPTQHPWMIGRSERRVFGGPWKKMDTGYRITKRPDGTYAIGAGTLMGVTVGAEVAVYGKAPRLFPSIGSPKDTPVGKLKVHTAERSSAVGVEMGSFLLPDGARGRMVNPGQPERLCVSLKPADPGLQAQMEQSPLLTVVPADAPDADVEVTAQAGGGWVIGNDVEPVIAVVPPNEILALRAGLESYHLYNTALHLAYRCADPGLSNSLGVRLLDCNNEAEIQAMSQKVLADPALPEAPRDSERIYALPTGFKFCVRVTNSSSYRLNVTLLNVTAGGMVEYLSDAVLRKGSSHVMWLDDQLGQPLEASPDVLPQVLALPERPFVTDRLLAIGTTKEGVDLRYLTSERRVQDVVDANLASRSGGEKGMLRRVPSAPAELWTACVIPVRMART